MKRFRIDSDYWLTMLTTLVLMGIGLLCLFSMFYYKAASAGPRWNVIAYQATMNNLATPLVIALCLLLVICVPKRMLPGIWLSMSAVVLLLAVTVMAFLWGLTLALVLILFASLGFQLIALGLLLAGRRMKFRKSGFWMQVGSILIHGGFILFIMDFAMLHETRWHLLTFWASTIGITAGCLLSFYAPAAARIKIGTDTYF